MGDPLGAGDERDLLTPAEVETGLAPRFNMGGLLRGNAKDRAEFYESAISRACWMTRNEARRLEDLNPLPGLDTVLTPMNMQAGAPTPAPGKKPTPGASGDPTDDGE